MRTPTSSAAGDRFFLRDESPNTSEVKMHPPQQQTVQHPNAAGANQRFASTAGIGSHPRQSSVDSGDDCERRDESRNEGRRSRRASYDASPSAKRQRFEIIKKLGSGTYGKVSLALDHRTGEEVAVKVIKKSAIENTADLIRIRREIRIMSALKHPHIIEIKEVFENDEKIILVMEYASGGELYDYVSNRGPLDELDVRRLFRQIVSAVFYCHKHGVAHRDLKLENILLDRSMDAKIADFGLSNYFKPHSLLHTFCGSPLYASPEIINGTPYKGPEVDCWSLGVLLYTLAYSSMPFDGRDFNRMIRQIKRGAYYEPDPPSSASMLIRCMLRVNPDRRYDITSIAAHWWLNYDENAPSIADLKENQVLDSTPLYIRQETLMIQSLGEENEVFAEYSHLSEATKKKIEEFRRRKKEENWWLTDSQSPLRKQSKKRSSSVINERKRQSGQAINQKQGSQANVAKKQSGHSMNKQPPTFGAPAQQPTPVPSTTAIAAQKMTQPTAECSTIVAETMNLVNERLSRITSSMIGTAELLEEPQPTPLPEQPPAMTAIATVEYVPGRPTATLNEGAKLEECPHIVRNKLESIRPADPIVIEEADRLINRLIEEALRGPVSPDLVESIRSSEVYGKEQFVKDILESVLVAQLPKPVTTPSMQSIRASRSRHSSATRVPHSASASMNSTPLPDQEIDRLIASTTPPPSDVDEVFIAPTAQLTVTLPHHNVIHQTVPEDAELELSKSATELARQLRAGHAVIEESEGEEEEEEEDEEKEEDVYSTDFEDMEEPSSEEEPEPEEANSAGEETDIELPFEETVPITTVDSFVSLPDSREDVDRIPEILPMDSSAELNSKIQTACVQDLAPFEQASPLPQPQDVVVRRGLAKRISRGKYERTKFAFGREITITDSPKLARRRIGGVQPQPKDAPKLFQKAKQYILLYPDPERGSPERAQDGKRRRYSDGDRKSEEGPTTTTTTTTNGELNVGNGHNENLDVLPTVRVENFNCPIENGHRDDDMIALSAQRRQERERERRHILDDYSPMNPVFIIGVPNDRDRSPSPSPNMAAKKRTYVTADEAKSVGAIEPNTLQVAPKKRQPSVEPLLDILEAGGGQLDEYEGGTAPYGRPRSPSNLARTPSNSALNAELRRHSYRSAMEDSLNSSQDGEGTTSTGSHENTMALAPPPLSPPPIEQPRVRYASPALTNAPPTEPHWMQYLDRDDQRQQTPTSSYGHGSETGAIDRARLTSPIATGYERNDEDYYVVKAYTTPNSYRSSSVFTSSHSREMSPAGRNLVSPIRTTHMDSSDGGYGNRSQKAKSWYTSRDKAGGSFEDPRSSRKYGGSGAPRFEPISKRSDPIANGGMGNYFRSFFDVAYNRVPRLQDQRYEREREKTPVSSASPFAAFARDASLKRRSKSLDKSQHGGRPSSDTPTRRTLRNFPYMADDRVDVSTHSVYRHESSLGSNFENVGGAGKFGSLLLNAGPSREPEKLPKGILKKQTLSSPVHARYAESDQKKSNLDKNSPLNFIDRIRRQFGSEKPSNRLSEPPPDLGKRKTETSSVDVSKPTSKKRSILQMARRRTIEAARISSGTDSGFGSGSISSDDYHISLSAGTTPIEKLKGFFSGNQSIKTVRESTPINSIYHHYPSYQSPGKDKGSYRKSYPSNHRSATYSSMARY